jgi:hypothetical protein
MPGSTVRHRRNAQSATTRGSMFLTRAIKCAMLCATRHWCKWESTPEGLEFHPIPYRDESPSHVARPIVAPVGQGPMLTIAGAKRQLAAAFGIKLDAIEITIRG